MITRKEVQSVFGGSAFEHGLFYLYEDALRFELSVSGSPFDMFLCAMDKAQILCNEVFADSSSFGVCLSFYGGKTLLSALSLFKDVKDCGLEIPKGSECWCNPTPQEGNYRHFVLFTVPRSSLTSVLWGAIAQDLGVRPRIRGSLYLFSLEKTVLANPYDDRGMDIISPDRQPLNRLYHKYNSWLLDYDRKAMDDAHKKL